MKRPKLAPDAPTELTVDDIVTIRLALNYAFIERLSYLDAIEGYNMLDAEKRTRKMVKDFDALHVKLFGRPTDEARQRQADTDSKTMSIFPEKNA